MGEEKWKWEGLRRELEKRNCKMKQGGRRRWAKGKELRRGN